MHALGPLFPQFEWASTGEHEGDNFVGDTLSNCTLLDLTVPHGVVQHQTSLGVTVSSEGNGVDNNPVLIKKPINNANNDREKISSLFASLRSCLPGSDEPKKLSIPKTISRTVLYIPELKEQVEKLIQKKEDLLVRVSGQRECYVKTQPKMVASYVSTVFTTKLRDNELMVQITSYKTNNFSIHNVLSGLEEDGFVLVDVSSSSSQGERLFYTLHLQVDKIDNYKLICEELLSQRILYLYEGCGNSFQ